MRKASIVSIGNEILSGQTVDTNASYLCGRLVSMGIPVVSSYTVGDEVDCIVRGLKSGLVDADVVIATGGLGPTDDDVTREAFARLLGRELELKEKFLEGIKEFFASRHREMSEKNVVQAYLPVGVAGLVNKVGTAPGMAVEVEGKLVFALPGVPSEMRLMFEESVCGRLKGFCGGQVIVIRKLQCFGTGESNIAEMLGGLMERGRKPLINCTAQDGVITLAIVGSGDDRAEVEEMVKQDESVVRGRLGGLVFGSGDETLAEVVGEKLSSMGLTVSVAESCTGGLLGKLLTDVAGSSKYFAGGWISYSNESKVRELGVDPSLIGRYDAVSEPVCVAMACGAREKAGTDFAIGITGIAGPGGSSEQKPVGLVYISIDSAGGCETRRFVLSGERMSVRLRASQTALSLLLKRLAI